ncbi:hypothetical protein E3T55_13180 [Cryobacterium frigoriphilum]|uniref:Uncharacterized protein n=1 Tax=Cryobacterium frigoriphilum TaxID=1259150 RepID=A0A4R8ZYS9_9MICO|nr:hypothetical protein [Cryobacterium frigoriphilum]TFD48982.1 hypothetical protein E3T55_13180 [Cryobacterium frigoriphilum]
MTTAVDDAVDAIRATAGVRSVRADVSPLEHSAFAALNDFWTASIEVTTEADAADFGSLAETVAGHVASARASVDATAIVRLPATDTDADTALVLHPSEAVGMTTREMASTAAQETAGELADAALTLRHLEQASTVRVADSAPSATVTVTSPDALSAAITELRTLPQFGTGALAAVTLAARAPSGTTSSVTASTTFPSSGLAEVLGELAAETHVDDLAYDGQPDNFTGDTWRPTLRVQADSPQSARTITQLLTGLEPAQAAGEPRASFSVFAPNADATNEHIFERTGFLGLALGSPEPDDALEAPQPEPEATETAPGDAIPEASPGVVALAPEAASRRLQSDLLRVTELLDAAGDTAGIRGTAAVALTACDAGTGEHVSGSVLLPIFEITDSAQAPFDAVARSWNRQGFDATDRGMGTDIYTPRDPSNTDASDSLRRLTLRGTAEGLSISAESVCVISG